jgi:methionyl-tRNA formyltransferase
MRIVMMGTGTFAEPTFQALLGSSHPVVGLVTQPDRVVGHERGSTRRAQHGMKEIALARGIPVFQPESINTPEGVARLREFQPDLLVVAAYGQILSRDVLSVPPHGGINVHASLLPKYRGAAPVAWAIYHGETQSGVSIIKMSIYLDAGEILAQEAFDIGPEVTAGELETRLAGLGGRLAVKVVDEFAAGTALGTKQDKSQATKAPKLTKENGLIDWTRTASEVCNQIRAMHPWPTAYTYLHRRAGPPQRLIITRARAHDFVPGGPETAGAVFSAAQGTPIVVRAGAHGLVEILELQPAGKRRMSAAEFLRGHSLDPGDRFGPENFCFPTPPHIQ